MEITELTDLSEKLKEFKEEYGKYRIEIDTLEMIENWVNEELKYRLENINN